MGRLKDKVAVVTGGASGFGEGMARRFAEEGAKVVVADLNAKGAERVAGEIGNGAIWTRSDVSQRSALEEMKDAALKAFGRIDIMVNNAGFTHRNGDMLEVDEETFDLITAVNMKAIYHAALAVVPVMEKQGGGVILTTASTAVPSPEARRLTASRTAREPSDARLSADSTYTQMRTLTLSIPFTECRCSPAR